MSKHEMSQRMVEKLKIGQRINVRSGVGDTTLVALGPVKNASEGAYAGLTVLHTTGDEFFPFATHTLYYMDETNHMGWQMTSGQSFQNLDDGYRSFKEMTGKQP